MQRADTILVNGVICTVDPSFRFVQALAVGDDKILYCGNNCQALQLQGDGTKIISKENWFCRERLTPISMRLMPDSVSPLILSKWNRRMPPI